MKNINICTILILEKYHFEVGCCVRDYSHKSNIESTGLVSE